MRSFVPVPARRAHRWRGLLAGALAIATLSACTSTVESSGPVAADGEPQYGGILRNSVVDPGGEIDPVTIASPGGTSIVDALTEKLTRVGPDYQVKPVLATEWSSSEDRLSWTVKIREGVRFTDGSLLDPGDVVATYNRIIAPDSTSPAKGAFAGILAGVAAQGGSVVFTLERPYGEFPYLLSGNNTQILPSDYQPGTWEKNYVGTGPFEVALYQRGQGARLEKNPDYWNADQVYLDGIDFKFFKDQQARVLALQSGEIDGLYGEPIASNLTAALDRSKFTVTADPNAGFTALALRTDTAPFDDVKVRQAVAWALDREAIVEKLFEGKGEAGNDTVYSSAYPVTPSGLEQRTVNPERVEELLGDRVVKFTITTSSAGEAFSLLLQQQLAKIDNFDVDVRVLSNSEYYATGDNAPWLNAPATVTYWGDRATAGQFNAYLYRTGASWNASHYSNPELDHLLDRYDAATTDSERRQAIDAIGRVQWNDVPVIVSAVGNIRRYLNPKVHMPFTPGPVDYTNVWIAK